MVKKISVFIMILGLFFVGLLNFSKVVKAQENESIINLVNPDLEGKEYLGNGVYRLINSTYTLDYNIYNGYLIFNGSFNTATNTTNVCIGISELDTYTVKLTEISGTKTISNNNVLLTFNSGTTTSLTNAFNGYTNTFNYNYLRFYFGLAGAFDNYTIKLQLEKGNTATDYQVPIQALEQHIQFEKDKSYDAGYDVGYDHGYDVGYDVGYYLGYSDGEYIGYSDGWNDGYNDGLIETDATGFGALLTTVFDGLGALLAIELLPNIYLGAIIAVPLVFGIIAFILGRKKGD